ncbi:MAG: hypothetical protein NVSMB29_11790 [Candidatus Dormibacteria bacterium]
MPRVLYVESGDEITDVMGRLRAATRAGEQEVALVLPPGTRALLSPVNLRLLKQASAQGGTRAAIVSGDPPMQRLARDAGLSTYASIQAYERGIELVRPHDDAAPAEPYPSSGRGGIGGGAAAATLVRPAPPELAGPPRQAPPDRPTGPARPIAGFDRRRPYYYTAVALAAVGLLLLLLVLPTARVVITLQATPVSVNPIIQGSPDPALATAPDHLLTSVVSADNTGNLTATPTGSKTLPAAAATGTVVIKSDLPTPSSFPIPKGEEFDTSDTPPVKFYATQAVTICVPGGPPAAICPADGSGGGADAVPVTDGTPQGRGNVPAGAINKWPQNPCDPKNYPPPPAIPPACAASDLTISNPAATAGGADAKKLVVASAQDVQGFQTQVANLEKQLGDALNAQLQKSAGSRQFAVDSSHSGLSITFNVTPPLPKPDDQYQTTQITVSGHGKVATYDLNDVHRVVRADLGQRVPQNEQLADNPAMPAPTITQASADDGTVILSAAGSGFARPTIDTQGLRGQFTGKGRAEVRRLAERSGGPRVVGVDVAQSPLSLPWLPLFSNRIEVRENVIAKASG